MTHEMAQRLMERVKQLREALGLTQESFAERAGLKYKHYQAVEAGRKTNIQLATLIKMARACGVEPWELLHFDTESQGVAEQQTGYSAAKAAKITPRRPKRRRDAKS